MAFSQSEQLIWNGTSLAVQLEAAILEGMDETGREAKEIAQAHARVDKGDMRDSIDYEVESLPSGARLTLSVGTDHGAFNELGTVHMSAQPMIRPGMDAAGPHLGDHIRAAVARIR